MFNSVYEYFFGGKEQKEEDNGDWEIVPGMEHPTVEKEQPIPRKVCHGKKRVEEQLLEGSMKNKHQHVRHGHLNRLKRPMVSSVAPSDGKRRSKRLAQTPSGRSNDRKVNRI